MAIFVLALVAALIWSDWYEHSRPKATRGRRLPERT
jgi:hypothetical protein